MNIKGPELDRWDCRSVSIDERIRAIETRLTEIAPTLTAAPKPAQEASIHEKLDRIGQDVTFCLNDLRQVQEHLAMREINHPRVIAEHAVKLPPDTGAHDEAAYTQMRAQERLNLIEKRQCDYAYDIAKLQTEVESMRQRIASLQAKQPTTIPVPYPVPQTPAWTPYPIITKTTDTTAQGGEEKL